MEIVIPCTINLQKITPQVLCIGIRRFGDKILSRFSRNVHVLFLVCIVIGKLIGYSGLCDTCLEDFRALEQQVECRRVSATPSINHQSEGIVIEKNLTLV